MILLAPTEYTDAVSKLGSRSPVGSLLTSADWQDTIPVALRERAFFSAQIENVRFLQAAQNELTDWLSGSRNNDGSLKSQGRAQFIERMRQFAIAQGMGPLDAKDEGSIKDIRSESRLGLIFDIQTKSAHDYGYWKQGMDEDVLNAFPAQRFIRVHAVKKPRPYHQAALGQVQLKTDLEYWIGLNRDFQVPWGPWGFNSGCDVQDVGRAVAESLGLLKKGQRVQPADRSFNDDLQASVTGLLPKYIDALKAFFGDQIQIRDGAAIWRGSRAPQAERQKETPDPAQVAQDQAEDQPEVTG